MGQTVCFWPAPAGHLLECAGHLLVDKQVEYSSHFLVAPD